jgi:hypothetical protein
LGAAAVPLLTKPSPTAPPVLVSPECSPLRARSVLICCQFARRYSLITRTMVESSNQRMDARWAGPHGGSP